MIKLPLLYAWPEALYRGSTTSYSLKERHLHGLNQINFVRVLFNGEKLSKLHPSVAISWLHIIFVFVIVVQNVRSRNLSLIFDVSEICLFSIISFLSFFFFLLLKELYLRS